MFFIILPLISMGIFTGIKYAISDGIKEEGHNFDSKYFYFICNMAEYRNVRCLKQITRS
jgi:hypothetical protein